MAPALRNVRNRFNSFSLPSGGSIATVMPDR